jgi:hypothetical protein
VPGNACAKSTKAVLKARAYAVGDFPLPCAAAPRLADWARACVSVLPPSYAPLWLPCLRPRCCSRFRLSRLRLPLLRLVRLLSQHMCSAYSKCSWVRRRQLEDLLSVHGRAAGGCIGCRTPRSHGIVFLTLLGGGGGSPKRLCIYSLLSMSGRCPHREQSAHVGESQALPRSPGCGGGGAPHKKKRVLSTASKARDRLVLG